MAKTIWFFADGEWQQIDPNSGIRFGVENVGNWLSIKTEDPDYTFVEIQIGDYSGGSETGNDWEMHVEGDMYANFHAGQWEMFCKGDFSVFAGQGLTGRGDSLIQMYSNSMFLGIGSGGIEMVCEGGLYFDNLPHGSDPGYSTVWVDDAGYLRQDAP